MAEQIVESISKWYQEHMRVADAISSTEKQLEVQDYYYICFMRSMLWMTARKVRINIVVTGQNVLWRIVVSKQLECQ